MKDKKLCCVFNYNPLYRFPIYDAISKEFNSDFFFGDSVFEPLKQFDANELDGFRSYLKAKRLFNGFVWFSGILKVLKLKYTTFLLTGSPMYIANWIVIIFAKLARKKVYCWGHGINRNSNSRFERWVARPFFKAMNGIYLYNEHNKPFMLNLGIKEERIHVIHNSLNTQVQNELYDNIKPSNIYRNYFKNDNPVVIFIGRIQSRMKVQYLIEAADILKKNGVNVNVVLVGAYMNGDDIEQQVKSLGLERMVWFYGPSFNEAINSELLFNADVCVAPGTVGLTAIHSLSYGTPVITHNNVENVGPEFEAIISGKTGDFFQEDDVADLANKITKWVSLPESKRAEVRLNARNEIQKNWSVRAQIELLKKTLF